MSHLCRNHSNSKPFSSSSYNEDILVQLWLTVFGNTGHNKHSLAAQTLNLKVRKQSQKLEEYLVCSISRFTQDIHITDGHTADVILKVKITSGGVNAPTVQSNSIVQNPSFCTNQGKIRKNLLHFSAKTGNVGDTCTRLGL